MSMDCIFHRIFESGVRWKGEIATDKEREEFVEELAHEIAFYHPKVLMKINQQVDLRRKEKLAREKRLRDEASLAELQELYIREGALPDKPYLPTVSSSAQIVVLDNIDGTVDRQCRAMIVLPPDELELFEMELVTVKILPRYEALACTILSDRFQVMLFPNSIMAIARKALRSLREGGIPYEIVKC